MKRIEIDRTESMTETGDYYNIRIYPDGEDTKPEEVINARDYEGGDISVPLSAVMKYLHFRPLEPIGVHKGTISSLKPNLEVILQAHNKAISKIKEKHNLDVSLITLSEHGVAVYDGEFRKHPTVAKEVFDVTGAGDTIIAALGYATACNKNIDDAVKFANLAAGVVVGKIGSSSATIEEIIKYESNLKNIDNSNIIIEFSKIEKIVSQIKTQNKKIVFTNGCFDILHLGHIKYLEEAKKCGDILIVGINSDESVKKLKGLDRPINSEYDRSYLLASLEIVDYVVVFSEETPFNLIKKIKPNILVKGGDYEGLPVIGEHIVDELKIVNFIEGKSTSETILNLQNKK